MAVEMRYGDYIKEGVEVVKANPMPSVVAGLILALPQLMYIAAVLLSGLIGPLAFLLMPVALIVSLAGPIVSVNYLAAVKLAKREGRPIEPGDLLKFENVVDKFVGPFVMGLGFSCCFVPGAILLFTPALIADRPGTSFINALKGAFQFGKANPVPVILLALVLGIVGGVGSVACGIGVILTFPIALAASWAAYADQQAAIEAAAAEGGVQL